MSSADCRLLLALTYLTAAVGSPSASAVRALAALSLLRWCVHHNITVSFSSMHNTQRMCMRTEPHIATKIVSPTRLCFIEVTIPLPKNTCTKNSNVNIKCLHLATFLTLTQANTCGHQHAYEQCQVFRNWVGAATGKQQGLCGRIDVTLAMTWWKELRPSVPKMRSCWHSSVADKQGAAAHAAVGSRQSVIFYRHYMRALCNWSVLVTGLGFACCLHTHMASMGIVTLATNRTHKATQRTYKV